MRQNKAILIIVHTSDRFLNLTKNEIFGDFLAANSLDPTQKKDNKKTRSCTR